MSTLLLRLRGPMQSWGISAKFDRRTTERVPSKSAVIGLIAAALGRKRDEAIDDLRALRFGVRVDGEGTLLHDYQTAKSKTSAYVTHRYYLSDAAFLAGLEGDISILKSIDEAIHAPVFPLYLGRRSCPPEGRVSLGIVDDDLETALEKAPWTVVRNTQEKTAQIVLDAGNDEEESYILRDNPVSFDQRQRKFAFRRVCDKRRSVSIPDMEVSNWDVSVMQTAHNSFDAIGGNAMTIMQDKED